MSDYNPFCPTSYRTLTPMQLWEKYQDSRRQQDGQKTGDHDNGR